MKRVALAFFAVALVAASAFADAPAPVPSFNFYANDGVIYNSSINGTSSFSNAGVDYGQGTPGLVSYVTIGLKGSNFGWSIAPGVLGVTSSSNGSVPFFVDHAYAYVNPVSGLTLEVGQGLDATVFNDVDPRGTNNFKSAWQGAAAGGWFTTNGVSVGALVRPSTTNATSVLPVVLATNVALPKLFTVNAYGSNDTATKIDQVHVSAALTAVDNLTLNAGWNSWNIGTSDAPYSFVDGSLGYTFGPATIAATVVDWNALGVGGTSNTYQYVYFKPNVTFVASKQVTFTAYFLGDSSNNPNYETLGQVAWTPVDGNTIKVSFWGDTKPNATSVLQGGVFAQDGGVAYNWLTYYGWTGVAPGYINASVDYAFSY